MLSIEQLLIPEKLEQFANFLLSQKISHLEFLPSTWISIVITSCFKNQFNNLFLKNLILSYTFTFISLIICFIIAKYFYYSSYIKFYENNTYKIKSSFLKFIFKLSDYLIAILSKIFTFFIDKSLSFVIEKELKMLFRNQSFLLQVFILFIILIFYLYNITLIPIIPELMDILSFINIGVISLIVASMAVRFVFPTFSIEGKTFYIIKTSPFNIKKYLKIKFLINFIFLLLFAIPLCLISSFILKINYYFIIFSILNILIITFYVCHFNFYIGMLFPVFDAAISEIPASFGGLIAMIISILYILILLTFEGIICYLYYVLKYNLLNLNVYKYIALLIFFIIIVIIKIYGYTLPKKLALDKIN